MYEYKLKYISLNVWQRDIENELNEEGKKGWELVSSYNDGESIVHVFKKKLCTNTK